MADLARGQRVPLSGATPATKIELGVDVTGPDGLSFDVSLFGIGSDDKLAADEWLVFYNNPSSPGGAVVAVGPHGGDEQVFRVDLDAVPPEVMRLVLTVTVDGDGTMASIARGHVRVLAGGEAVLRYPYYGADFTVERSLVLAEVYRHNGWRVGAVGQGYAGGLAALVTAFGGEVNDESSALPPAAQQHAAPVATPDPTEPPPIAVPGDHGPAWQPPTVGSPHPLPPPPGWAPPLPPPGFAPPPPPAWAPAAPPPEMTPPPAAVAPPAAETIGLGPDLSVRQEYRIISVRDKFFGGRMDPEQLETSIEAYVSEGWEVVGTTVDRRGHSRDDIVVLLGRPV